MLWKIDIEHTREGLDGTAVFLGGSSEDWVGKLSHADIEGLEVDIDNGIYKLFVYPNSDGGFNVSFYKCEEEIFSDGCATDWDELEEDDDKPI